VEFYPVTEYVPSPLSENVKASIGVTG